MVSRRKSVSWNHVSRVLSGAVTKVEAFKPSVIIPISSEPRHGGDIPARLLRARLHDDGFDVPVCTLSSAGSLTPGELSGARVLLVEKADDTRRSICSAVAEVEKVIAAAAAAAGANWQPPQMGVFVLSCKKRAKSAELPAELQDSYFAAEEVDDAQYEYPWDHEDSYLHAWRTACLAADTATVSGAQQEADEELVLEPSTPQSATAAAGAVRAETSEAEVSASAAAAGTPTATWRQQLGTDFIAAWRAACAGFDADQRAAAEQQQWHTWREQLGEDFIQAWRYACGRADAPPAPLPQHEQASAALVEVPAVTPKAPAIREALALQYINAYRSACA